MTAAPYGFNWKVSALHPPISSGSPNVTAMKRQKRSGKIPIALPPTSKASDSCLLTGSRKKQASEKMIPSVWMPGSLIHSAK